MVSFELQIDTDILLGGKKQWGKSSTSVKQWMYTARDMNSLIAVITSIFSRGGSRMRLSHASFAVKSLQFQRHGQGFMHMEYLTLKWGTGSVVIKIFASTYTSFKKNPRRSSPAATPLSPITTARIITKNEKTIWLRKVFHLLASLLVFQGFIFPY